MLWQLLLLQAGFFLLLILALQKLFHGHLVSGIKRMEKLQDQNLKKEEELHRMQAAARKQAEKTLAELELEISAKRGAAEEEVKAMKQAARSMVEEEKNTLLSEAQEKERFLTQRLERDMGLRASEVALGIVANAFSPKMLQSVHAQLADELLDSLMTLDDKKIHLNGKSPRVRTAFPLSNSQKETLKARIFQFLDPRDRAKNASSVELTEEIDTALLAGFVVYLGEKVLDGSLHNKFSQFIKNQ